MCNKQPDLTVKSEIMERLASSIHPRRDYTDEQSTLEAIIHAIYTNKFTLIENKSEENEE